MKTHAQTRQTPRPQQKTRTREAGCRQTADQPGKGGCRKRQTRKRCITLEDRSRVPQQTAVDRTEQLRQQRPRTTVDRAPQYSAAFASGHRWMIVSLCASIAYAACVLSSGRDASPVRAAGTDRTSVAAVAPVGGLTYGPERLALPPLDLSITGGGAVGSELPGDPGSVYSPAGFPIEEQGPDFTDEANRPISIEGSRSVGSETVFGHRDE